MDIKEIYVMNASKDTEKLLKIIVRIVKAHYIGSKLLLELFSLLLFLLYPLIMLFSFLDKYLKGM